MNELEVIKKLVYPFLIQYLSHTFSHKTGLIKESYEVMWQYSILHKAFFYTNYFQQILHKQYCTTAHHSGCSNLVLQSQHNQNARLFQSSDTQSSSKTYPSANSNPIKNKHICRRCKGWRNLPIWTISSAKISLIFQRVSHNAVNVPRGEMELLFRFRGSQTGRWIIVFLYLLSLQLLLTCRHMHVYLQNHILLL